MRTDGHMHLQEHEEELIQLMEKEEIHCMLSSGSPIEAERNLCLSQQIGQLHPTAGIHPWHADKVTWEAMLPYIESVRIIGEIGMDCVWCDVDLAIQKQVFEKQLAYASSCQKPVVLHTKGQEKEILDLISQYPNTYLVHWYSCMDYLEGYQALGCYFTIGPSIESDAAVQQIVNKLPLDHLMVETDGLPAVAWALGKAVRIAEYPDILDRIIHNIAKRKKQSFDTVQTAVNQTFFNFLHKGEQGKFAEGIK